MVNSGSGLTASADLGRLLRLEVRPPGVSPTRCVRRSGSTASASPSLHPGRTDTDMQRELVAFEGARLRRRVATSPSSSVVRAARLAIDAGPDASIDLISVRPSGRRERPPPDCAGLTGGPDTVPVVLGGRSEAAGALIGARGAGRRPAPRPGRSRAAPSCSLRVADLDDDVARVAAARRAARAPPRTAGCRGPGTRCSSLNEPTRRRGARGASAGPERRGPSPSRPSRRSRCATGRASRCRRAARPGPSAGR